MTPAERKRAQRDRERQAGYVRLERSVRPEWIDEIDRLIGRLSKKSINKPRSRP